MSDATEPGEPATTDQVFDLLVRSGSERLADYRAGWIDDPSLEADRWDGRWSEVSPSLQRLTLLRGDAATAADRRMLESIQSGTPWPSSSEERGQLTRRLYDHLARTGAGEAIFRKGPEALERYAYPPGWREWVPSWAAERYVGIGSPWSIEPAAEPLSILDLGCGAGVDVRVALHQHPAAAVVGCDRSTSLLFGSADWPEDVVRVIGDATAAPLGGARFDLIVANGLPPALGTSTLGAVASECHRLLARGGELRFTCLAVGPDLPLEEIDEVVLFNALRIGKPVLPAVRAALDAAGLEVRAVQPGPSPFVEGFRSAGVRSVTVSALRRAST